MYWILFSFKVWEVSLVYQFWELSGHRRSWSTTKRTGGQKALRTRSVFLINFSHSPQSAFLILMFLHRWYNAGMVFRHWRHLDVFPPLVTLIFFLALHDTSMFSRSMWPLFVFLPLVTLEFFPRPARHLIVIPAFSDVPHFFLVEFVFFSLIHFFLPQAICTFTRIFTVPQVL